jgi:GNAT superfamily N-acetyltransferase
MVLVMALHASSSNYSLKRTSFLAALQLSGDDLPHWRHVPLGTLPSKIRQQYGNQLAFAISCGICLGIWRYIPKRSNRIRLFVSLIEINNSLVEMVWLNYPNYFSSRLDILCDVTDLVTNQLLRAKGFQWFSVRSSKSNICLHHKKIIEATILTLTMKNAGLYNHKLLSSKVHEYNLNSFDLRRKLGNWIKESSLSSQDAPEWDLGSDAFVDDFPDDARLWLLGSIDFPQSYLVFTISGSRCRILTVGTLPNFRLQGTAGKLFLAASTVMRMLGWRYWEVRVDSRNIPALKLFDSLGFCVRSSKFAYLCMIL